MTTARKRAAPAPQRPAEKTTLDYLEHALDDLGHAGEHAQQDARASIDGAVDRIRDAMGKLGGRARDEAYEWQDRLEHLTAEARPEHGRPRSGHRRRPIR